MVPLGLTESSEPSASLLAGNDLATFLPNPAMRRAQLGRVSFLDVGCAFEELLWHHWL
uniref:Uncharacterized protein n=1 Tax=Rhizobium leguminosarum bv. viciae TaxID=387 RepID=A0A0U3JB03_RHILV|nr:hypothetical protein [Rhizobium leguminosarum bv. viciae]